MIRRANKEDLDKIVTLGVELNDNFKSLYNYESLNEDVNETFVIVSNNDVIGFIHIQNLVGEIDIINFIVDKDFRNNKNGYKLLKYIIDNYVDKKIFLEVAEDNEAAIKLYKRNGFIEINRRNNYYSGKDAIIMERK